MARSNYGAIEKDGVKMETHSFGNYHFQPASVFASVDNAAAAAAKNGHEWDYVVVTTKALPDRGDGSALISPVVTSPSTVIVIIQNGVGVEAPYRARFPPNPIVSAVTVISAEQTGPGVVRQNRWTRISIGPYTDGRGTGDGEVARGGQRAIEELSRWWGQLGGIRDVDPHDEVDLQLVRWHKLCINSAMNPSAVLSGGRGNADMVMDPELREHLKGVMDEIRDAMPRILGKGFPESLATPEKIIKSTERNKGGRPSMLLDWDSGRPMELEVILGNPVRIARERGVCLPRMQSLYALLKSAQQMRDKERGEGKGKL